MNLQSIIILNAAGFMLLLILTLTRKMTRTERTIEDHLFTVLIQMVMVACIVEPLTFYVDAKPGAVYYWINLLGNTYLYTMILIGAYVWCIYVDFRLYKKPDRVWKKYRYFGLMGIIMELGLIANIWGGFLFYVDDKNVYHRGAFVLYVFYFYFALSAACSIFILEKYKKTHGNIVFFPIWMFMIPVFLGCLIQAFFYGVSTSWMGAAMGIVAIYMSLQNEQSYVDGLTGLYNRQYLDHAMWEIKVGEGDYYGIMMDLNFFKKINDTLGHSVGDQALKDTARILIKSVMNSADCTVFRFAGDEFIILIKAPSEAAVVDLEEKIRKNAKSYSEEKNRPYEISISMGHDKYERGVDTDDTFFKKIDAAMYIDKERAHGGR